METIPKPAATVLLINPQGQVYMTKRPATMKFLAGHYVFPGGAVDEKDSLLSNRLIAPTDQANIPLAYYVAAAREVYEEIGVFLGCDRTGEPLSFQKEESLNDRKRLLKKEISFIELLKEKEAALDCRCFTYIGHKTTPAKSPIRFDTRFFITRLPKRQQPIPDPYEVAEARWIYPKDALHAYEKGEIKLINPTIRSLEKAICWLDATS